VEVVLEAAELVLADVDSDLEAADSVTEDAELDTEDVDLVTTVWLDLDLLLILVSLPVDTMVLVDLVPLDLELVDSVMVDMDTPVTVVLLLSTATSDAVLEVCALNLETELPMVALDSERDATTSDLILTLLPSERMNLTLILLPLLLLWLKMLVILKSITFMVLEELESLETLVFPVFKELNMSTVDWEELTFLLLTLDEPNVNDVKKYNVYF
jgi:hypothetical protein